MPTRQIAALDEKQWFDQPLVGAAYLFGPIPVGMDRAPDPA